MNSRFPLRLEEYYFPIQEVVANPSFSRSGNRNGSKLRSNLTITRQNGAAGKWLVELVIDVDQDASENPPYFFRIQAFGVFALEEGEQEALAQSAMATLGAQILVGAIRERLASLTARAPWGQFFLGIVPIQASPSLAERD